MRVVIDGRPLVGVRAGIGRYTWCLAESLAAQGAEVLLFTVSFRGSAPETPPGTKAIRLRLPGRAVWGWWYLVPFPPVESFTGRADVVHGPNFVCPPSRAPSVVTVHDLAFVRHPETLDDRLRRHLLLALPRSMSRAAAVIVPSASVKDELVEWSRIDPVNVHVIAEGVRPIFRDPPGPDRVVASLGIEGRYLLWSGAEEPRKNLPGLFEVFSILARQFPDLELVLTGPKGWKESVVERVQSFGLEGRVRRLGYVSDSDLAALMAGAACFVFPSLYEGFGLPPLEAMAAGAPVVAARAGALPEVLGEAALYADPNHPEAIAEQVRRVLTSSDLSRSLVENGRRRAASFKWEEAAARTLDVYRRVTV